MSHLGIYIPLAGVKLGSFKLGDVSIPDDAVASVPDANLVTVDLERAWRMSGRQRASGGRIRFEVCLEG
jgi:hypothetical protein